MGPMISSWLNLRRLITASMALLLVAPEATAGPVIEPTMEPVIRALSAVPKGAPKGTRQAGSKLLRDRVEKLLVDRQHLIRLLEAAAAGVAVRAGSCCISGYRRPLACARIPLGPRRDGR